jgi:hypothetical protein
MANCLEPGCSDRAVLGSDFCRHHQVTGKPIVYLRKDRDGDLPTRSPSEGGEGSLPGDPEDDASRSQS